VAGPYPLFGDTVIWDLEPLEVVDAERQRDARGRSGGSLRGGGGSRTRTAWAARRERLPRDHGHLAMLHESMSYVRQFAPHVLAAVRFAGSPGPG
jgi:hypothetical protein